MQSSLQQFMVEEDNTQTEEQGGAVLGGPVELPPVQFENEDVAGLFGQDGSMKAAGSGEGFTVTMEQEERVRYIPPRIGAGEDSNDEYDIDECPKCGAREVEAAKQIMQTRAADESGTEITRTSCGCTFRRSD